MHPKPITKIRMAPIKFRRPDASLWAYVLLAGLLLGPLLLPGYILSLDMVFTPVLRQPEVISSSYGFRLLLHWLDVWLPADLIQKLLLALTFVLCGYGAHRLAAGWLALGWRSLPTYMAGLFYTVNPFTYERFIAGQYYVLLGYALLPWVAWAVWRLGMQPSWRRCLVAALWLAAVAAVSIHSLGPAVMVTALLLGSSLWRKHSRGRQQLIFYGVGLLLAWLVLNAYWLLPTIAGTSSQAQFISSFSDADRSAFATLGDNAAERIYNVLLLQGFWPAAYGLYQLPQFVLPGWLWALAWSVILALVLAGAWSLARQRRRAELLVVLICILAGVVLASGVGAGWLSARLPFFAGYREPHKLAMLVAFGYAMLLPAGLAWLRRRLGTWRSAKDWLPALLMILLALPFVLAPNFVWAAAGQLRPVQYPDGWYTVNQRLNEDNDDFQTVFLPWHLYLHTDFAGRLIANPAVLFFDKPVIVSDDPEIGQAALDGSTPAKRQINAALQTADTSDVRLGSVLAALDVKYIIFAKESDYREYDYIYRQSNFKLIYDDADVTLYQNQAYRP